MESNDKTKQPGRADERHYRIAISLLLLLITYGSLYPLTWTFSQPKDFIFRGPVGLADLLENVILFLPLGWLVAWHHHSKPKRVEGYALWFLIALVIASILQWLQKYLPRTPALSDIAFNMLGFMLGLLGGAIVGKRIETLFRRNLNLQGADRFALAMIVIWVSAELFPFIPTFDRSSLIDNVKSIWEQDVWQPRRMLLHAGTMIIGLDALAHLLRSAGAAHLVGRMAIFATLGLLVGRMLIVSTPPGLPVVLGVVSGALAWAAIYQVNATRRFLIILATAFLTYLLHAIWPLQLAVWPGSMSWLPFSSSLSTSIEAVVTSAAFESLCFGGMIWSAVRSGASLRGTTILVAILALGCEWLQCYIPGRTAEITSTLLALGMGWLVAALRNKHSV